MDIKTFALFALLFMLAASCLNAGPSDATVYRFANRDAEIAGSNVLGFGILYRLPGLWNGPVTSDTPAGTKKYTMTHVHPGTYCLYAYNDINGDKLHKTGDYMASKLVHIITVPPNGSIDVETVIDFILP